MTEHRIWITIPGLPVEDEEVWEPFIEQLERDHEYGAVIAWHGDEAQVILAIATESATQAARAGVLVVTEALESNDLGDLYPTEVEIELVAEDELAAA